MAEQIHPTKPQQTVDAVSLEQVAALKELYVGPLADHVKQSWEDPSVLTAFHTDQYGGVQHQLLQKIMQLAALHLKPLGYKICFVNSKQNYDQELDTELRKYYKDKLTDSQIDGILQSTKVFVHREIEAAGGLTIPPQKYDFGDPRRLIFIKIADAGGDFDSISLTIIHEFTHFALCVLYNNLGLPSVTDRDDGPEDGNSKTWSTLLQEVGGESKKGEWESWIKCVETTKKFALGDLNGAFQAWWRVNSNVTKGSMTEIAPYMVQIAAVLSLNGIRWWEAPYNTGIWTKVVPILVNHFVPALLGEPLVYGKL